MLALLIILYLIGGIKIWGAIIIYLVYKLLLEPDIEIKIGKEEGNGRQ